MFLNLIMRTKLDSSTTDSINMYNNGTASYTDSKADLATIRFNPNNTKRTINNTLYGAGITSQTSFLQNTPWLSSVKFNLSLNTRLLTGVTNELGFRLSSQGYRWKVSNTMPCFASSLINRTDVSFPVLVSNNVHTNAMVVVEPAYGLYAYFKHSMNASTIFDSSATNPNSVNWYSYYYPSVNYYYEFLHNDLLKNISLSTIPTVYNCIDNGDGFVLEYSSSLRYLIIPGNTEARYAFIELPTSINLAQTRIIHSTYYPNIYYCLVSQSSTIRVYITIIDYSTYISTFTYKSSYNVASSFVLDDAIFLENYNGTEYIGLSGHVSASFYIYKMQISASSYYPSSVSNWTVSLSQIKGYSISNYSYTATGAKLQMVKMASWVFLIPCGYYYNNRIYAIGVGDIRDGSDNGFYLDYQHDASVYYPQVIGYCYVASNPNFTPIMFRSTGNVFTSSSYFYIDFGQTILTPSPQVQFASNLFSVDPASDPRYTSFIYDKSAIVRGVLTEFKSDPIINKGGSNTSDTSGRNSVDRHVTANAGISNPDLSATFECLALLPNVLGFAAYTRGAGVFQYVKVGDVWKCYPLMGEIYRSNGNTLTFRKIVYLQNIYIAIQTGSFKVKYNSTSVQAVPNNIYFSLNGEDWIGIRWKLPSITYNSVTINSPMILDCLVHQNYLFILWVAWRQNTTPLCCGVFRVYGSETTYGNTFGFSSNSKMENYNVYTGKLVASHSKMGRIAGFVCVIDNVNNEGVTTFFKNQTEYNSKDFGSVNLTYSSNDLTTSRVLNMVSSEIDNQFLFVANVTNTNTSSSIKSYAYLLRWDVNNSGSTANLVKYFNTYTAKAVPMIIGYDITTGYIFIAAEYSTSYKALYYGTFWDFNGSNYFRISNPYYWNELIFSGIELSTAPIILYSIPSELNINGYYTIWGGDNLYPGLGYANNITITTRLMERFPTFPKSTTNQMEYYESGLYNNTSFGTTITTINAPMALCNNIFFMGVNNKYLIYSYMYNDHPERNRYFS